jgi:hypothetical protein
MISAESRLALVWITLEHSSGDKPHCTAQNFALTRRAKHWQNGIIEKFVNNPRGKIRRGFFHTGTKVAMMRGSVLFPTTSNVAAAAKPELDLNGWPSWMRDAPASQPGTKAPPSPSVEIEPAPVNPASVRKLIRLPSRS